MGVLMRASRLPDFALGPELSLWDCATRTAVALQTENASGGILNIQVGKLWVSVLPCADSKKGAAESCKYCSDQLVHDLQSSPSFSDMPPKSFRIPHSHVYLKSSGVPCRILRGGGLVQGN